MNVDIKASVEDHCRTKIVEQVEWIEEVSKQHRMGLVNSYEFANRCKEAAEIILDTCAFYGGWKL